jgi:hypothetical protein
MRALRSTNLRLAHLVESIGAALHSTDGREHVKDYAYLITRDACGKLIAKSVKTECRSNAKVRDRVFYDTEHGGCR